MHHTDRWIRGAVPDAALALSWVPFAVAARSLEANAGSLRMMFAWVMFISFAHQPLTFPLVYGSPWRLATHKRLFTWFPAVALAVIAISAQLSMTLVVVVGGIWNAEHVLMQRYGLTRVYGRKAKDDQGWVERWMLVTWFLVPLLWTTARGRLDKVVDRMSSGSVDAGAARVLATMTAEARVGVVLVGAAALYLTVRWAVRERRLEAAPNYPKWLYLASTAALFGLAFVDPVAAIVGFVASHSVEYFVLVNRSVASEARQVGPLSRVSRRTHGRLLFFAFYGLVVAATFLLLYRVVPASLLLVAVLVIGATHFFYDAFIWKLRNPNVTASLAAAPPETGVALEAQPA
jgi:hypothetical protein